MRSGLCCQQTFLPLLAGRVQGFPVFVVPVHLSVLAECTRHLPSGIVAARVQGVEAFVVAVQRTFVALSVVVWAPARAQMRKKKRKEIERIGVLF